MSSFNSSGADTPSGIGGWPPHVKHARGNRRLYTRHTFSFIQLWQISWGCDSQRCTFLFKFQLSTLVHNQRGNIMRTKSLQECVDLLHAVILQIRHRLCSLSLMKQFSWWKRPHAERDLSGGLHCIALYQPLRGFYCDLHINEHLSVCSRYHLSWEQCSFSVSKTDLCDKHVKLAILHSKASFKHVTVYVCVCVCMWVFCTHLVQASFLALNPDRWMVAGELKGTSQRWLATHSLIQASFLVCMYVREWLCECVCL